MSSNAITVDLTSDTNNTQTTTLNITSTTAASLGDAESLTVKTDVGDVKLDSDALNTVSKADSAVALTVEETDTAADEVAAYTVTLTDANSNNLLPYGQDAGRVTITVPKAENATQVWYVTGDANNRVYVEKTGLCREHS